MSDRRKLPITRYLLSLLPSKIRFTFMRDQLKIPTTLDSKFVFRIARTKEELSEAYRILQDSYLELGYTKWQASGMRIVKYFALPSTTTLIAEFDNKVVGTVSIIRRGSFGLPMDTVFDLSPFIDRHEVIAEVSSLAIDSRFRQKRGALFLPLLKYFWEYVEGYMNLDSIVITVNPVMTDFYEGFLSFKRLKQSVVDDYSFANGNPAVGLYLNIREAPKVFSALYNHKSPEKNLFRYFVDFKLPHFRLPERKFYKSSDPVMTKEMLEYFFIKKSTVFAELTLQEKMGLAAIYPDEQYREVLPYLNSKSVRDHTRYLVNIKGNATSHKNIKIAVVDVAKEGLCVTASEPINGPVLLEIKVADGRCAELIGEVRWQDLRRNIYGIYLNKTDIHWDEFVEYLREDFSSLSETDLKKAA